MFAIRFVSVGFICLVVGCQASRPTQLGESFVGERVFSTSRIRVVPPTDVRAAAYVEPGSGGEWATLVKPTELPVETGDEVPAEIPLEPLEPSGPATPILAAAYVTQETELESKLTLGRLEDMALANNPSLAEAYARVNAARGKWVQVGLPPNTVLGYSGQQLGSGGAAEQHGVFIGQEFVRGGKLCLDQAIVAMEVQRAEQQEAMQQQRVVTDVRFAFYDVLVAQRRDETANQLVDIARDAVATATALLAVKDISEADMMRSRIELQSAQLMLKNAGNRYIGAWIRLIAVAGVSDLQPQPLDGDVEQSMERIDADDVLARLVSESPEMAVALSEVERARRVVARARAEPIGNVDVQAVVQSDNGTGSSNANLQISLPIPWLNSNQGGIRQARAEVIAAERAVERLELDFKRRLAIVYQRYANARNQVVDYSADGGILENSRLTLDLARKGYHDGDLSYLDLITGQRMYFEVNLAYIEALGQLWSATVEIDGMLLKGSLGNGDAAKP
ncbi:MAG: TolC family protein [Pirellulaceae bacterium]